MPRQNCSGLSPTEKADRGEPRPAPRRVTSRLLGGTARRAQRQAVPFCKRIVLKADSVRSCYQRGYIPAQSQECARCHILRRIDFDYYFQAPPKAERSLTWLRESVKS